MRYLVVGYGNIGQRRARLLGERCEATVDPYVPGATHRAIDDVPTRSYDAAILATPNDAKLPYLRHLLALGKSVLVEKPLLFASWDEAEALQRRTVPGTTWYTSYNHRYEPLVARLRTLLHDGAAGAVDRIRMVYGNGTVRNWRGTWRESGLGVLEDLGCHLLDLAGWLLAEEPAAWELWDLRPVESRTYDYGLFATADRRVVLEVGTVFWKNAFRIDVYGGAGSLHLDGLGKWGGATLTHRARVYPSGAPRETREESGAVDATWAADLAEFERRVASGVSSLENDWRISEAISALARQAPVRDLEEVAS
jgi:predicted dehydrogenase